MSKRINLNDANAWSQLNWDEPEVHPMLKRTDAQVNRGRANQLKAQNPDFQNARISALHQTLAGDEWKRKNKENGLKAQEKRRANTNWIEHHQKLNESKKKAIQTPYGQFNGRADAIRHLTSIGVKGARNKIADYLKNKPTEWYYL